MPKLFPTVVRRTVTGGGGTATVKIGPGYGTADDDLQQNAVAALGPVTARSTLTAGAAPAMPTVKAEHVPITAGAAPAMPSVKVAHNPLTAGSAPALGAVSIVYNRTAGSAAKLTEVAYTYRTGGTYSLVVPAGATTAKVEGWGGGAGGGNGAVAGGGGGGGGGGAYARTNAQPVTPGDTWTVTVPAAVIRLVAGQDATFVRVTGGALTAMLAKGGSPGVTGTATQGAGGPGGTTAASTGDVKFAGGNGGGSTDITVNGAGGGGGAGTANPGGAGQISFTPGAGGAVGGGSGGAGGNLVAGSAGSTNGGGGGGGYLLQAGGDGAAGQVTVTFTFP